VEVEVVVVVLEWERLAVVVSFAGRMGLNLSVEEALEKPCAAVRMDCTQFVVAAFAASVGRKGSSQSAVASWLAVVVVADVAFGKTDSCLSVAAR